MNTEITHETRTDLRITPDVASWRETARALHVDPDAYEEDGDE